MGNWACRLYRYVKKQRHRYQFWYDPMTAKNKLYDTLALCSKHWPYLVRFRYLPLTCWPMLDQQIIEENQQGFLSKDGEHYTPLLTQAQLTGQEKNYLAHGDYQPFYDTLVGFYCPHGFYCIPKALYWIEHDWIDEHHERFVPVVTTLTRKKNMMVRYRLNQLYKSPANYCNCYQQAWVFDKSRQHLDEILYLPHLFEKRSLPIFKDELTVFFKQFSSIHVNQIVQQSIFEWQFDIVIKTDEKSWVYESEGFIQQLSCFLATKQMKAPAIKVIINDSDMQDAVLPLRIKKELF